MGKGIAITRSSPQWIKARREQMKADITPEELPDVSQETEKLLDDIVESATSLQRKSEAKAKIVFEVDAMFNIKKSY
jgi:hypothetical protein